MGLTGIWHGAGFQFLVFGLLHAMYLSVNHAWRIFVVGRKPAAARQMGPTKRAACVLLTFVAVLVAQAFFRANGVGDAMLLVQGMIGMRGIEALDLAARVDGLAWGDAWRMLLGHHMQLIYAVVLQGIAWFTPNAHQILGRYSPALFATGGRHAVDALAPHPGLAGRDAGPAVLLPDQPAQGNPVSLFPILTATRSRSIAWISRLSKPKWPRSSRTSS